MATLPPAACEEEREDAPQAPVRHWYISKRILLPSLYEVSSIAWGQGLFFGCAVTRGEPGGARTMVFTRDPTWRDPAKLKDVSLLLGGGNGVQVQLPPALGQAPVTTADAHYGIGVAVTGDNGGCLVAYPVRDQAAPVPTHLGDPGFYAHPVMAGHNGRGVRDVRIAPDGKHVAIGFDDGGECVRGLGGSAALTASNGFPFVWDNSRTRVGAAPRRAAWCGGFALFLAERADGDEDGHPFNAWHPVVSNDPPTTALRVPRFAGVADVPPGAPPRRVIGFDARSCRLEEAPQRSHAHVCAAAFDDGTACLFRLDVTESPALRTQLQAASDLRWNPDGTLLAIAGVADHTDDLAGQPVIRLFDAAGALVRTLCRSDVGSRHAFVFQPIEQVAWEPNGQRLAIRTARTGPTKEEGQAVLLACAVRDVKVHRKRGKDGADASVALSTSLSLTWQRTRSALHTCALCGVVTGREPGALRFSDRGTLQDACEACVAGLSTSDTAPLADECARIAAVFSWNPSVGHALCESYVSILPRLRWLLALCVGDVLVAECVPAAVLPRGVLDTVGEYLVDAVVLRGTFNPGGATPDFPGFDRRWS